MRRGRRRKRGFQTRRGGGGGPNRKEGAGVVPCLGPNKKGGGFLFGAEQEKKGGSLFGAGPNKNPPQPAIGAICLYVDPPPATLDYKGQW